MKNSNYSIRVISALTSAAMALLVGQSALAATTSTWTGSSGSTDWNSAGDWGGTLPVAGNALVFTSANASTSATLTNSFTSGTSFAGITFNAGALTYTMTGNSIALSAGVTNNGSNTETFSETGGVTNSASSTFTVNSGGGNISFTTGLTDSSNASQITTVNGAGGTLNLSSFTLNSGNAAVTDTFNGTGNVNITGAVTNGGTGANALAYIGSGTLTLGGTNTYTGQTTFEGGSVILNYGSSGNQISTAALTLGSNLLLSGGSNKSESVASTTVAAGYAANIQASAGSGDTINLGAITFGANATINFQPGVATTTNASGSSYGTYGSGSVGTLDNGWATVGNGSTTADFATTLSGVSGTPTAIVAVPTYYYLVKTSNSINQGVALTPNASGQNYTDIGTTNSGNPWKIDTSNGTAAGSMTMNRSTAPVNFYGTTSILYTGFANYTLGGNPIIQAQNSSSSGTGFMNFTTYGTGTFTISSAIYGNVYYTALANNVFSGLYTQGGNGNGTAGNLNKSGPGVLVLSGTNNYVGNTEITAGTLSVGSDSNLGGVSGLLTLAGTGASTSSSSVQVSSSSFPSSLTLVGSSFLGSTITQQSAAAGGVITLTLAGNAGVTATSGNYAYANGQQVLAINGTLQATNSFTLGETATGTAGGTDGAAVANYRAINLGANGGTIDVTGSNTLTVPGVISSTATGATGVLTKIDSGTLVLDGANTYTGGTAVNGGTLKLDFGASGVTTTGVTNFVAPTSNILASTGTLSLSGGTLNINSASTAITNAQTLAKLTLASGANAITMTSNGSSTGNNLTFTSGTIARTAGSTIDFVSPTNTSITLTGNNSNSFIGNYAFFGTGATEGYASTGSGGVVGLAAATSAATASNFVSPTGNYSYTLSGGTDTLTASATANSVVANLTSAETISLGASNFSLTLNGLLNTNTSGALTIQSGGGTGTLAIGASNELVLGGASNITISAPISGSGGALTDSNTGTVTLSGVNTYTGPTTVNTGTLSITGGSLTGSNVTTAGTGIVNQSGGVIGGATATFTQNSTGTSTLSGLNTYGGLTTVSNGELDLSAAGQAIGGTGGVAVSGGTLKLTASNEIATGANLAVSGGTFNLQANNQTLNGVQLTGGTIAGTGTLTSSTAFDVQQGVASAVLAGTAGLTKSTSGVVLLSGANTYTGTTAINGGTVQISALNNLGSDASAVTLSGGGILAYSGGATSFTRGFTVNTGGGEIDNSANGLLTIATGNITTNGTLIIGGIGSTTVNSVIGGGSGGLTVNLDGTLTLGSANTYTGATTINAGIVSVSALAITGGSSSLGNASSAVSIADGADLSYTGNTATFTRGITFGSAGGEIDTTTSGQTLTIGTGNVVNSSGLTTFGGAGNTSVTSVIGGGTGGLTKTGAGTLTLSSANTYTGVTTVSGGTLSVSNVVVSGGSSSLGNASSAVVLGGGDLSYTGTGQTFTRGITLTANSEIDSSTAGTLTIGTGAITGAFTTTFGGAGNTTVTSNITTSVGGLTKTGAGTLTLQGANTYTGVTTINNGVLSLNSSGALSTGNVTFGGGTLQYTSNYTNDLSGKIVSSTAGPISIDTNGQNISFGTALAASNTGGLTKLGAGTLTLASTDSYTGVTTVNAGTLSVSSLASGGSLGTATSAVVLGGGDLSYTGTTTSFTRGFTLTGSSEIDTTTSGQTLTIATGNITGNTFSTTFGGAGNTTVSSNITTTTGGLTKNGSGTLTLSGANTFTGGVTINAGTLQLGSTGALNSTGGSQNAVAFGSGSTGTLALNGNNVTVASLSTNANPGTTFVTNGSGTIDTLTVGNASNSSGTYAGTIQDGSGGGMLALATAGNGTLTLNGTNSYSGGTTIGAGVASTGALVMGNSSAVGSGTITLNGGSLAASTPVSLSNDIIQGTAGVAAAVSGSNTITANGNLYFNGTFGNPSSFLNTMTGGASFTETGTTYLANSNTAPGWVIFGGAGNTSLQNINGGTGLARSLGSQLFTYGTGTLTLNGIDYATGVENFLGGTVVANEGGGNGGVLLGNKGTNGLVLGSNLVLSGGTNNVENLGSFSVAGQGEGRDNYERNTINLGTIGGVFGGGVSTINFQPGVAFTTSSSGTVGASGTGFTGLFGSAAVAGNGLNSEDFATSLNSNTSVNAAIIGLPTYLYSIIGRNTSYTELIANAGGQTLADSGSGNWLNVKIDTSNTTTAGAYNFTRNNAYYNTDGANQGLLYTGFANYTLGGNAMVQNTFTSSAVTGLIDIQQYGTGTLTINNNLYGTGTYTSAGIGGTNAPNGNIAMVNGFSNGNLVKSGPGTVILGGTNNYVGNTFINGGVLSISSDSNLGGISGTVTVTSATTSSTTVTVTGVPVSQTLVGASFLGTTITSQGVSTTPGVAGGSVVLTLATAKSASAGVTSYANGQQVLEIDGGTLQATNSFTLGETNGTVSNYRSITLGVNGGTIDVTGANTLIAPGVIAQTSGGTGQLGGVNGVATLTKVDSGTLVLAGANTYTGGTIINGGTLKLDFGATGVSNFTSPTSNILASAGALTLGGGTLSINGAATATANTQTIASLALSGGANTIALTPNSATSVGLTFTNGNIARTAGSTIDFNPAAGTSVTLTGNANNAFLGAYAFYGTGATEGYAATGTGGLVQAAATTAATQASNFSSATTNYTYGGAGGTTDSSIAASATANTVAFNTTAAETIALGANTLTLNGMLNNGGAVTISGTGALTIGSSNELVIGGSTNVSISAPITGAAGAALTDSNTGTVALSGVNTYTGPTTVNAGTLSQTAGSLTGSNVVTAGTGIVNQSGGVIAGSTATFTQNSTGTSTLSGLNTYGGLTTVSNGELDLSAAGQAIGGTGGVAVSGGTLKATASNEIATGNSLAVSGGTYNLQGFNQTLNGVQLTGGSIAGTGTLTSTTAYDLQAGVASAVLAGSAGLTKSTTGVLLLSGANTYTGTTAINGGTVEISSLNNLGADTSAVTLGGGTLSYTGTTAANFTRGFNLTASSEIDSSSGLLTISSGAITGNGSLTFGGAGTQVNNNTTVSSNITTGSGGLNVNVFGTLSLSGANTFTGLTTLNNGVLNLNSAGALGGAGLITFNGGTLQYSANNTADVSGQIFNSTANGPISVDTNGQSVTYASGLDASNVGGLTKLGAGTLTLSGANAYAGNTLISAGTLEFTNINSMTSATVTANAGTTLAIGVGGTGQFTNGTSGAGTIGGIFSNTGGQGGGVTLNTNSAVGIDTTGGSVTYSGNITNAGVGLTKLGTNTLNLAGVNTYTGPTTVSAGALIVSGSTGASSAVTINSGGSLVGDSAVNEGTLNGSVTVAGGTPGGAINLRDGTIGTLNVGSLTLNGGTLSFDVGAGSSGNLDLIASAGTLTVGGATKITIGFSSGTPTLTDGTYSLITYTGTALSGANFSNLSLSSTTLGAYTLQLINGSSGASGVELKISGGGANPTTYSLSTTASASRILVGQSTTLTTTITNTGAAGSDTLSYTGLGSSSAGVTGSTTSSSTALALGASGQNTVQHFTGSTTGNQTISPSVGTATNGTVGGNATLSGTPSSATVDVVALRTINNGAATSLGTVHSGATVSGAANAFSSMGSNATTTSVQVAGGNGAADSNGVTLTGSSTTFNGATSGLVNGSTQTFGGTITNANGGTTTGSFNLAATTLESGLGDTYAPVSVAYTANVYTGKSTWNNSSSGAWGTITGTTPDAAFTGNWTAAGGAPGVSGAAFNGMDTATFGAQTSTAITVGLNNAAPNVNSITFSSPTTSYTLAQNQGTGTGSNSITLSGTTPSINVTNPMSLATAGTQTISAPVILGATTSLNVAPNQTLNMLGAISSTGTYGLNNVGGGATILSSSTGNSYSGPTTISAGKVYVTNASGSGTGSGAISVTNSGVLNLSHSGTNAGSVSGAITLSSGGSFYSGGVSSGNPITGVGTGATLTSALNVNGGNLTFALSNGGYGNTLASPATTTTFISTSSTVNFTGSDSITLVDLTNGGLSLRMNQPYLLISSSLGDAGFSGLVTLGSNGVVSLDGDGYVLGVWTGGNSSSTYTYAPITFNEFGSDGVTPLSSAGPNGLNETYLSPTLVLEGGNLEVVPEPGTWALMIGGLALLVVIQRRRNKA